MAKLFSQLAALTALMIITAGAGVYNLSESWIVQAKRESAANAAQTFTQTLSAQIDMLNRMLDKMANSPEVIAAINKSDTAILASIAGQLQAHFPDALQISLLPLAFDTANSNMSFADLNMVRETFISNQLPEIHGDDKATSLAITRPIKQNKQTIGVVLLSMSYDFIGKSLRIAAVQNGYIELKQDKRLLVATGDKKLLAKGEMTQTNVTNGNWQLYYYYDASPDFSQLTFIIIIVIFPVLISLVLFLITQRRLSNLLKRDTDTILQACKDMLKNKPQGSYPINLKELRHVVLELLQFKRMLGQTRQESHLLINKDEFEIFTENDVFGDDYTEL